MSGVRGATCQARLDALIADCQRRKLPEGHPDWPDEHARPEEFHSMTPWRPVTATVGEDEEHGLPGEERTVWVRGCSDCDPLFQSSPIPGVTKGI